MDPSDADVVRATRRWVRGFTVERAERLLLAARDELTGREHAESIARMLFQLQLKHRELMGDAITAASHQHSASVAALTRPLLESAITFTWAVHRNDPNERYRRLVRILASMARPRDVKTLEAGFSSLVDQLREGAIKRAPQLGQQAEAIDGPDGLYAVAYERHYSLLSTYAHPTARGPAQLDDRGGVLEIAPRGRRLDRIGALHLGCIYFHAAYIEFCTIAGLPEDAQWAQERHAVAFDATNTALADALGVPPDH